MPRFLKVIGVPGNLVPDPRSLGQTHARYIGMQFVPPVGLADGEVDKRKPGECWVPLAQLVPDVDGLGAHLKASAKDGGLKILSTSIAKSIAEAIAVDEAADKATTASAVKPKNKGE